MKNALKNLSFRNTIILSLCLLVASICSLVVYFHAEAYIYQNSPYTSTVEGINTVSEKTIYATGFQVTQNVNQALYFSYYVNAEVTLWPTEFLNIYKYSDDSYICSTGFTPTGSFDYYSTLSNVCDLQTGIDYYFQFDRSSNNADVNFIIGVTDGHFAIRLSTTSIPADNTTSIYSFTYSTTTKTANIQGYIDVATSTDIYTFTFWQQSDLVGQSNYTQFQATTSGSFNVTYPFDSYQPTTTATTTPNIGVNFTLYALIEERNPFTNITIDLASSSIEITEQGTITSIYDLLYYQEYECSITSLTGCIKNSLIWSFYPTPEVISQWNIFKTQLFTKAPLGYVVQLRNLLTSISATSTATISNIAIPKNIKDDIFAPLDIGLGSVIWLFYIVVLYKRFKLIQV